MKSVKVSPIGDFKASDIDFIIDKDRGIFKMSLKLENTFNFIFPKSKLVALFIPTNIKKKDDMSHLESCDKYSILVGDIQNGIISHKMEFKGKNGGTFKIEELYLRIAKYTFPIAIPEFVKSRELILTVPN